MKVVLTFSWLGEDGGFQGKSQGRCSRSGDGRDRAGGPCVLLQPHYIGCHCEADTVGRSNPAPTSTGRLPRTLRVLAMTGARSTFMPPWASHFDRPVLSHVEGVSAQPEPCRRARRTRMRGSAPKVPRHAYCHPERREGSARFFAPLRMTGRGNSLSCLLDAPAAHEGIAPKVPLTLPLSPMGRGEPK